jgi:protein SCO1/2
LTDNRGNPFTKERLKDRWTLIFFGFTNCGYVCPTTLTELTRMYEMLQKDLPEKELPQVVLVSVDPERDSIEKMNDYVTAYHPTFIGVRSDTEGTQRITDQFHISAIKMQSEGHGGDHYMINHSAEIILINPDAKIQAYLSYPHKAEQLAKDYKLIVKRAV